MGANARPHSTVGRPMAEWGRPMVSLFICAVANLACWLFVRVQLEAQHQYHQIKNDIELAFQI